MSKNILEKKDIGSKLNTFEDSCMKIPEVRQKILHEKKLSNFVNVRMKEYKNDEIKLNKLQEIYKSYLGISIGKNEKSVDKNFYKDKYESKRKETIGLFKKLRDVYEKKIEELKKNSSNEKTNNFMDNKTFQLNSKLKDGYYYESNKVNEIKKEIDKKEKILEDKKHEYENMDYFMYNIQNKINSSLNDHKECAYDYNTKNCPPDNYNSFVFIFLLNIVTLIGNYFLMFR